MLLLLGCFYHLYSQIDQLEDRCVTYYPKEIQPFENWLQAKEDFGIANIDEVYRIPVVIHILHMGEPIGEGTNLSDEVVQSQLAVINQDFRREAGTRGYNEHPAGGDAKIEFVLAERAPDGSQTSGIVRIDVTEEELPTGIGNALLLSAHFSYWNSEHYLNIWSMPWLPENTLLGVARFPESDLPGLPDESQEGWNLPGIGEVDGVVVNAHHFGKTDATGPYHLGRTLTHELGHFLGLFHVWGPNDLDADGCDLDDFCTDTPPTRARVSGCPTDLLACDGRPAMVENYMDYADDACMNIFTQDQIRRMRTVLENSPRRKSLINSPATGPILDLPDELFGTVNIYPNPVSDRLIISINNHRQNTVRIQLHDMRGRVILDREVSYFGEEIEVLIPPITERILILTVISGEFSYRQKLLMK